MNKIVVIGSLNIDVIQHIPRLPKQGETLAINNRSTNFGGKGANQAVAAARQGASVSFVGSVGKDFQGENYIDLLNEEKINTKYILPKDQPTGAAYIMLEPDGHNTILVHDGANGEVTAADVRQAEEVFEDADVVVAQLEVPQEAVLAGFELAHKYHAITILNPAPVTDYVDPKILEATDLLIPNETEAAALIKEDSTTDKKQLEEFAGKFDSQLGIKNLIITLGSDGVFIKNDNQIDTLPIFKVKAVDTTAAGDTFIGTTAAYIKKDIKNIKEVALRASKASSIAVTRPGAIPSIPTEAEVTESLNEELK